MESRGAAYTFPVAIHTHALNWNPQVESPIEARDGRIAAGPGVPWTTVAIVPADAAYDRKVNWNRMRELGMEFIANIDGVFNPEKRGFGCGGSKGCATRAKHALRILEVGREKWKEGVGYSRRWRIEGTFSDLKGMFGDALWARDRERVAEPIGRIVRCPNSSTKVSQPSVLSNPDSRLIGESVHINPGEPIGMR